ncbi:MAG: SMC-Scp complex subunit ScpB [Bifidobacterium sp.]|nr:SMC-Scp complex subunit ScpB [Bifidobacterium sp.]
MSEIKVSEIDDASFDEASSETDNKDSEEQPARGEGPDAAPTRPEYVDFSVEDFPGGLESCLEAILMVADQPQQAADMARVLALDEGEVTSALESMQREYDGDEAHNLAPRGFELRHTARGWQYGNRAVFEPVVSAFVTDGQMARLSQAALEALAIVAYKQPVTRAQIAAIRGVNSDGVVRALSVRGLIREEGADSDSRAAFLVTTGLFLEKMGLESLDQLPELAPFMPAASDVVNQAENAETDLPAVA